MKMEKPTVEVVRFSSEDVIATSGGFSLTVSNFKNNIKGDLDVYYNGTHYGFDERNDLIDLLKDTFGPTGNETDVPSIISQQMGRSFNRFYEYDHDHGDTGSIFYNDLSSAVDGTYIWYANGSNGARWYKQP